MLNRIHRRLGTAGFVISIIALVAALGGGAYAAKSALTSKQKKEVETIAKKYAGKQGATGPAGAVGAAGPAGAKGDSGVKGDAGLAGVAGSSGGPGQAGESVEAFPSAGGAGEPCEGTGGVVYEVQATATPICNGKEGSPWTAGGTLPKGATETGVWSVNGSATDTEGAFANISFAVPLPARLNAAHVVYVPFGTEPLPTECEGVVTSPAAQEGYLCVYEGVNLPQVESEPGVFTPTSPFEAIVNATGQGSGAGASGGLIRFGNIVDGFRANGSWAVTGG